MKRYHITVGAKTTAGGTVRTGWAYSTIDGQAIAREGDEVDCPQCASTGLIVCDGPHLVDLMDGRNAALDGDLCQCQCDPPPRLIANQTLRSQLFEDRTLTPRGPATGQPLNNHLNRPASTTPGTHGVAPSMPFGERPNYFANLADIHQRMPFVLKAAAQFDELLRRSDRHLIEHAILDIAAGLGVR